MLFAARFLPKTGLGRSKSPCFVVKLSDKGKVYAVFWLFVILNKVKDLCVYGGIEILRKAQNDIFRPFFYKQLYLISHERRIAVIND